MCPIGALTLESIFSLHFERTVNRDNTVSFQNLRLQIEPVRWRGTLAGCAVTVHQHLNGTLSLSYGPHTLGRCDQQGVLMSHAKMAAEGAVEKPQSARDSHFPTAPAAAGD